MKNIAQYTKALLLRMMILSCGMLSIAAASPVDRASVDAMINDVVATAESYLGTPHRMGGLTTRGIDCSGLMVKSFESAGIALPRTSGEQANLGEKVKKNSLQRGDLVFFKIGTKISHVGLVTRSRGGETLFIHTSSSRGVMVSNLGDDYWKDRFTFGRRVWEDATIIRRRPQAPAPTAIARVPGNYPEASIRTLKRREVKRMSQREAALMQAEIWARNGYQFKDRDLQRHFERQPWYRQLATTQRRSRVKRSFSDIEKKNLKRLRKVADLEKIR